MRETHHPRRYRLLATPPFTVEFPSVVYRVDIEQVTGAPQWALWAKSLSGSPEWMLCRTGEHVELLEREIYHTGFEVMWPTAAGLIMEKLVEKGRAHRLA